MMSFEALYLAKFTTCKAEVARAHCPNSMSNKGLAFSLGGVRKVQAVKARSGLNKPFKASALAIFETPEDDAKEVVPQPKRPHFEPAGCCVFPVVLLLPT